jgi:ubiquinone/menaquinone biosynthesis C-methylase UbiE
MSRFTKRVTEYYSSDEIIERYTKDFDKGLTDKENRVIDRYFDPDGGTVLDLGCGTGRTTAALVRKGFNVVGVDLIDLYVERARSMLPESEFVVGDAVSLPFADGMFDYVLFSYNGIDDIKPEGDRYRVLLEISRVLDRDGVFAFSSRNFWFAMVCNPFSPASIRENTEFWSLNHHPRWLLSRYKMDNRIEGGPQPVYYIRPRSQKKQLVACGFDVFDVVRERSMLRHWFDPFPYYVARNVT